MLLVLCDQFKSISFGKLQIHERHGFDKYHLESFKANVDIRRFPLAYALSGNIKTKTDPPNKIIK